MSFTYKYARPSLTVDAILLSRERAETSVLLIQRANEPFKDQWAFPGGFVDMDETADQAVLRELKEETGIEGVSLKQMHTFSEIDRDPRDRVVSIAYMGTTNRYDLCVKAADDAKAVQWFPITDLPELAFDHGSALEMAIDRLAIRTSD